MNAYTNVKKLDLDNAKKDALRYILGEIKQKLPKDMQRIYDCILHKLDHLPGNGDRIMLCASEMDICVNALRRHEKAFGKTGAVTDMLAQLSMTRKQYQEYQTAHMTA